DSSSKTVLSTNVTADYHVLPSPSRGVDSIKEARVSHRIMEDVKIVLSASWAALMLTYLLGDVLRIYSGDYKEGKIGGIQVTQNLWLGIAVLMVIPVVMFFLSLTLNNTVNRWSNIIVSIFFLGFNLLGLPGYPSAYDRFLIIVGLGFNVLTVWYAWTWV